MRRRATGKDVAEKAGVSLTTVSFVLNGKADVAISDETRQRVIEAARELGYRPNSLVRGLVRGRTQTIGVIVPRLDSSFHAAVVHGIQSVCDAKGYRILLADSEHGFLHEKREVELLLQYRADGLISVALPDDAPNADVRSWVAGLVADRVALVVVDDSTVADLTDCVMADDVLGARMIVEHLIGLGHRRIAHLSAGEAMSSSRDRCAGYLAALAGSGLDADPSLIAGTSYFMSDDEIAAAFLALLARRPRPTAVFAANDDMAAACISAARARRMRIPTDLAVAGYGDTAAGRILQITTVQQDPVLMGRTAADRLFERLDRPDLPPKRIVLPVEVVPRSSTVPPRRGAANPSADGHTNTNRPPRR
jgi:DNA-binding LacI/PurR family transcriptional regulator